MKKRTVLILALALVVIVAAVLLLWLRPSSVPKTVAVNETNFPDENFRTVVNQYDGDRDGVLSSAELSDVTWINCADHGITSRYRLACSRRKADHSVCSFLICHYSPFMLSSRDLASALISSSVKV